MNDDVDMKDGAGLDAQGAAAIMQEAGDRARRELRVVHPVIFISGGVAWLLGEGGIWFSVRGQHPYQGPAPEAAVIQGVLVGLAVAIAAAIIGRATSGVGGVSLVQRRVSILAFAIGIAATLVLEAAIDHAGASRSVVFGVYQASAPVLVAGVFYCANSALRLSWPMLGLGLWLMAVASGGAFAGPVGDWAVNAVAGSLGYLAMAALLPILNRR